MPGATSSSTTALAPILELLPIRTGPRTTASGIAGHAKVANQTHEPHGNKHLKPNLGDRSRKHPFCPHRRPIRRIPQTHRASAAMVATTAFRKADNADDRPRSGPEESGLIVGFPTIEAFATTEAKRPRRLVNRAAFRRLRSSPVHNRLLRHGALLRADRGP